MAVINSDIAIHFHSGDLEALREIVEYYPERVFYIGLKLLDKKEDAGGIQSQPVHRMFRHENYGIHSIGPRT